MNTTSEVPKLVLTKKDGFVIEIKAVWEDGREYSINDLDFIRYVNINLCTLQSSENREDTAKGEPKHDGIDSVVPTRNEEPTVTDNVNHPKHYTSHPSGIECIAIARHYDFAIGNAIKYLWRHGLKTEEGKCDLDKSIEDLKKAAWYIEDEIMTLENKKKDEQAKVG